MNHLDGICWLSISLLCLVFASLCTLRFLAKGYKNAEIIELTGLSINTIRSHTKAAYQKLEVGNMMDAVLRARELGLIE